MTRALSTQIVVRDTATGATVLAPRAAGSNGAPMTGEMLSPSVSADGRREPDKLVSRGAGASGAAVPGIWRPAPGTADNDDGGQRLEALAPTFHDHPWPMAPRETETRMISKLDFIGIPSQDAERSRSFYVDTLGLRPDDKAQYEVWVGDTCFGIWEPERIGMPFSPQKNAPPALHVDDVAAARAELEAKGVKFNGDTLDTGVCHMALFSDPDGNDVMLHHRYSPRT